MSHAWTEKEIKQLKKLHAEGRYFFKEIAEKMGRDVIAVRHKARKLGLELQPQVKARMGGWNSKHAHLRESVFKYFLTHSWAETKARFALTESELKSLFTVGYKDPKLAHLRKDARRKDSWTLPEIRFLIQNAGIRPRTWISKKLKRGGVYSVKESLNRLNIPSKHINGLPFKWAETLFQNIKLPKGIKTKAGPTGGGRGNFMFRIIPWVQCEALVKKYPKSTTEEIKSIIRAMATFQRWIYGCDSTEYIVRRIKNQVKGR